MNGIVRKLSSYLESGFLKEKSGRISILLFCIGILVVCCNHTSEHIPPLQGMRSNLIYAGIALSCWLLASVLGLMTTLRGGGALSRGSRFKFWLVVGFESLFFFVAIVGLLVGAIFYLKCQRLEEKRIKEEATSVRAKFGDGKAYDAEMANRISREYQERLAEVKRKYQIAGSSLTDPMILDLSGVTGVEELQSRIEIVTDFIAAAEELRDFIANANVIFEAEANRHQISPETRTEILKGFSVQTAKINPMIVKMRDAELRKCRDMLKLVELLKLTWGKWTWDSDSGGITFNDDSRAKVYSQLAARMKAADAEIAELQKEIESFKQPKNE